MIADATLVQAEALLVTLVEVHDGDLRAAFAVLCAAVPADVIAGEAYQDALSRAIGEIFGPARPDYP